MVKKTPQNQKNTALTEINSVYVTIFSLNCMKTDQAYLLLSFPKDPSRGSEKTLIISSKRVK